MAPLAFFVVTAGGASSAPSDPRKSRRAYHGWFAALQ